MDDYDMVLLTEVEQQAEAEVIISMLDAYGIHAARSGQLTRRGWYAIQVNEEDLRSARALLARAEEPDEVSTGNEPPSFSSLTMRTGAAAIIAVLVIMLATTYAGSFASGEIGMSRYGLLHTSLLMCAGAIIGSAFARMLCDRYIGIYSRKAVMVALVAYYAAGPIWLLFRYAGGDPEATLLQVAPGLCIVIASLVFWPAGSVKERINVSS
ncbi:hypothetical protein J2T09_004329 [Neorhizobium huautlense]|uniref:DUF2007 domain-containing protein n=1 Tax=Neorhizobium huautlense TaxID=67774 RepID=A0ABT9PZN8_9HYPH|nr:hypothetical protein [Neorhizobium huautlense]MDP9839553.1 hypothetical protein [Neorhizobium huautlense]